VILDSYLFRFLRFFGIDLKRTFYSLCDLPRYIKDVRTFQRMARKDGKIPDFPLSRLRPFLADARVEAGVARGQYFHQDLLVARRIFINNPEVHFDVGSRLDGFVAHVASFRLINVADIRPLKNVHIPNMEFVQADFMKELPDNLLACCDSASSLHAIEHFGLGRYGDMLDPDGYRRGMENLLRLLKPGGKLYFSVPMGPQRMEFNAHRFFAAKTLFDFFAEHGCRVDQFSYVDDKGDLYEGEVTDDAIASNFGCSEGLAIFEITVKF